MQGPRFPALFTLALLFFSAHLSAAEDPRDLSGVWQAFTRVPVASSAAPDLNADGEIRVADYNARYPNPVDPAAFCVPPGMPEMMTEVPGRPFEFIQSFSRLALFGRDGRMRRIRVGDETFPENAPATRSGQSLAHWEGDTLVVETRFLEEQLAGRWPRSASTTVTERITKLRRSQVTAAPDTANAGAPNDDVLEIKLTISDPDLYRAPQDMSIYYQRLDELPTEPDCAAELWRNALEAANR